jgi:hypothetical protein
MPPEPSRPRGGFRARPRKESMPLLHRQARSTTSQVFLDSAEGRALWHQMEGDWLRESIESAGFAFPLLAIESASTGFFAVGVCREAGHCEPKTATAACVGTFFPVRLTLVELATLRTHSTSLRRTRGAKRAPHGSASTVTPLPQPNLPGILSCAK